MYKFRSMVVDADKFIENKYIVVRRGKKKYFVGKINLTKQDNHI